jgi:hypothetical protein
MKTILITAVLILSYTGYGSEVNETTTTIEYIKPKKKKKKHRRKRKCYNSTILVGNGKYKKRRR